MLTVVWSVGRRDGKTSEYCALLTGYLLRAREKEKQGGANMTDLMSPASTWARIPSRLLALHTS
eukprot:7555512-Pyramimonas_sp.AAC.1